jgi:hypothetical protein
MAKNIVYFFVYLVQPPAATTHECNWWFYNMPLLIPSSIFNVLHTLQQVTLEGALWIQICLIFSSVSAPHRYGAPSLNGHSHSYSTQSLTHTSILLECISLESYSGVSVSELLEYGRNSLFPVPARGSQWSNSRNSSYRLNFDLGTKNKFHYHS